MAKRKHPSKLVSDAKAAEAQLELSKAQTEAAKWRRRYKDAMTSASSYQEQVELLLGIQGKPPIQTFEISNNHISYDVAVVIPATDWHVEERISLETTNGKNHFNLGEAEDRIKRFYTKALRLIQWQQRLAPVGEIWHPLLGDLMSGYIHEELTETNQLSPTEASLFLQEMLCSGINLLLRKTKLPINIPTCVGNHGRTTPRKRIKTSAQNSFEWLLYMTLAKYYAKNKRVHWMVGRGYHNTQEIMGRLVRFHHGDGLRYQGGVGGITIPVNKAISQWDKAKSVDFDIFGHWHTFFWGYNKWIACGSLMGYSEYSVEIKAEHQHPTQTFIVIDRRYGVTVAVPIFVTSAGKKK